mmetsp:Transcript_29137/g.58132  ORF Transcript_29137/g.58132 Transcript_29137/m.58132 type:complete len:454 (-) Transcript_29137:18-1379(-)
MTSVQVGPKAIFLFLAISALTLPRSTHGFSPSSLLQGRRLRIGSGLCSNRSCYNHGEERNNDNSNVNSSNIPTTVAMDRRSFGTTLSGIALSSLLLSSPLEDNMANAAETAGKMKRILITGSNSGIGMDAAMRMAMKGHEVVLACRTLEKATNAAEKIKAEIANSTEDAVEAISLIKTLKLIPMECNLADLTSIDNFVSNLKSSAASFDAVCYNAGIARNTEAKEVERTKQGFELTVGTNHLGHFYLNHLMMPLIEKEGGRIVVTASGVHDPESPGGAQGEKATLGDLSGLENAVANNSKQFDMVDGRPFNADKAYKDSKLCNVLFTRELQRRLNASGSSSIYVNAFNPGLIVGTGLFRDQNQVFTKLFDVAATNVLKVGETTHWGGGALEYMTLSEKVGEKGGLYYTSPPGSSKFGDAAFDREFDVSEVSKEARDDDKAKRLWELSEKLVGI